MLIILMVLFTLLILYPILFHSYRYERRRANFIQYWKSVEWEMIGKVKPKLWWILLSGIVVLIPAVNIIVASITWVIYLTQGMRENESNDGYDLVEYKTIVECKPLDKLLELLNKEL